jgi:hypothetical protein
VLSTDHWVFVPRPGPSWDQQFLPNQVIFATKKNEEYFRYTNGKLPFLFAELHLHWPSCIRRPRWSTTTLTNVS